MLAVKKYRIRDQIVAALLVILFALPTSASPADPKAELEHELDRFRMAHEAFLGIEWEAKSRQWIEQDVEALLFNTVKKPDRAKSYKIPAYQDVDIRYRKMVQRQSVEGIDAIAMWDRIGPNPHALQDNIYDRIAEVYGGEKSGFGQKLSELRSQASQSVSDDELTVVTMSVFLIGLYVGCLQARQDWLTERLVDIWQREEEGKISEEYAHAQDAELRDQIFSLSMVISQEFLLKSPLHMAVTRVVRKSETISSRCLTEETYAQCIWRLHKEKRLNGEIVTETKEFLLRERSEVLVSLKAFMEEQVKRDEKTIVPLLAQRNQTLGILKQILQPRPDSLIQPHYDPHELEDLEERTALYRFYSTHDLNLSKKYEFYDGRLADISEERVAFTLTAAFVGGLVVEFLWKRYGRKTLTQEVVRQGFPRLLQFVRTKVNWLISKGVPIPKGGRFGAAFIAAESISMVAGKYKRWDLHRYMKEYLRNGALAGVVSHHTAINAEHLPLGDLFLAAAAEISCFIAFQNFGYIVRESGWGHIKGAARFTRRAFQGRGSGSGRMVGTPSTGYRFVRWGANIKRTEYALMALSGRATESRRQLMRKAFETMPRARRAHFRLTRQRLADYAFYPLLGGLAFLGTEAWNRNRQHWYDFATQNNFWRDFFSTLFGYLAVFSLNQRYLRITFTVQMAGFRLFGNVLAQRFLNPPKEGEEFDWDRDMDWGRALFEMGIGIVTAQILKRVMQPIQKDKLLPWYTHIFGDPTGSTGKRIGWTASKIGLVGLRSYLFTRWLYLPLVKRYYDVKAPHEMDGALAGVVHADVDTFLSQMSVDHTDEESVREITGHVDELNESMEVALLRYLGATSELPGGIDWDEDFPRP